ncbi:MAG: radical SAM protein [Coriobacteriales bacterium]|jgi:putative pyruvate formate lyase activating enzyme|nr:radical SAM protein [Coriobacteriales bacterium]
MLPADCNLCPRRCGVNRANGERGVCGADDRLLVARAALHHWEEPPISGSRGSGTVFFSNCPLHCVYCQNAVIAAGQVGQVSSVERLAEIFAELAEQGAHNINLVTPTQYVLQIIAALEAWRLAARTDGNPIPVVYNTSGYETTDTIKLLSGYVDVYLTDFRYASPGLASRYSSAPDYAMFAMAALVAMVRQVGEYSLDEEGMLRYGVIVRFLLLPGQVAEAKQAVEQVFAAVSNKVCYSLMNQYTPMPAAPPELQRPVSEREYAALVNHALDLGITNSFMQEGGAASESFIPPFDLTGV